MPAAAQSGIMICAQRESGHRLYKIIWPNQTRTPSLGHSPLIDPICCILLWVDGITTNDACFGPPLHTFACCWNITLANMGSSKLSSNWRQQMQLPRESKKQDSLVLPITLLNIYRFYPPTRSIARYTATWLGGWRLSVTAGIVSKRLNLS